MPPEAFGSAASFAEEDVALELQSASNWDIATRYHEFKGRASLRRHSRQLRRISADAIIERAQAILGAVVHPTDARLSPWSELPGDAEQLDLDMDETLENAPLGLASASGAIAEEVALTAEDLWMSWNSPRRQAVILSVDTSLSMTGEKLALTAVALAVVLLQFPDDPIGVVAFENEAKVVKKPEERLTLQQLIERFLDVPAQGYTHLEDGLRASLRLSRDTARLPGAKRPPSTVLLTDGKYTAGRDPAYLAPRFHHLVVLKMGRERASLELCREMARKGRGALQEVGDLEALPMVMYGVVKDLLRGRSVG